jgi:hypothetical protein
MNFFIDFSCVVDRNPDTIFHFDADPSPYPERQAMDADVDPDPNPAKLCQSANWMFLTHILFPVTLSYTTL